MPRQQTQTKPKIKGTTKLDIHTLKGQGLRTRLTLTQGVQTHTSTRTDTHTDTHT